MPTLTAADQAKADQAKAGQFFINAADGLAYRALPNEAQGCGGCAFRHAEGCQSAPQCGPVVFEHQDASLLAWRAKRETNSIGLPA